MLKTLMEIGNHMISARVLQAIGEHSDTAYEVMDAGYIAEIDGYHTAISTEDKPEPGYLDLYPELQGYWDNGYQHGIQHVEIQNCSQCQDPDVVMCTAHDHPL